MNDPTKRSYRFLTDMVPPGLAHAAVLRSPLPHASIASVDTSAALRIDGVLAVATHEHIPGLKTFGIRRRDQPFLCIDRVRSVGDPVAVVAAETEAIARQALSAIAVRYAPLPVIGDVDAALRPDAPALREGGNLLHRTSYARGDLEAAFARAAHIVEDVYETGRQMHAFIEPEGAVAVPGFGEEPLLTVFAPGHWAEDERRTIAAMLAVDPAVVRVVASPVGGSYGGKDQLHAQPLAALLAHLTRRPVKLIWRREESVAIGVKRHPFRIRMRSAIDHIGRVLAHDVDFLADTGAYAQHGPEVLETAHENALGPYAWQATRVEGRLVYSNAGVSGAMRGFGALQIHTALEQQIDRLADAAGIPPAEFRRINLRDEGAPCQLGQTLVAPSWHTLAARSLDEPKSPSRQGRYLIGEGIALVEKGEGFARGGPNGGRVDVTIADDGRLMVRVGFSDIGQGLGEAVVIALSRALGIGRDEVGAVLADTAATPDSGPIAASRGAGFVARASRILADRMKADLTALAATRLALPAEELRIGPGGIWRTKGNAPLMPFAQLAPYRASAEPVPVETDTGEGAVHASFSACAARAEVAVDRLTGQVRVRRVWLAPVTGEILTTAGLRAQMEGGASMAAGFVTMEQLPAIDGRFSATNLDGYFIPSTADSFPVEVYPVEGVPPDALGPRGVGEIGVNAAAPAIINAIRRATGFVCRRLPVDPAAMLAHLDGTGQ